MIRQFFTLGTAPVVVTDTETLTFGPRVALIAEVVDGDWRGPYLGLIVSDETPPARETAAARRAHSEWTWGAQSGDRVFRFEGQDPDAGADVGPVERVLYDGYLAGVDSRRMHDFSKPFPRLVEGAQGFQIRRDDWRGAVTALGIVG